MTAPPPTALELALCIGALIVVAAMLIGPHLRDWINRRADEGEPDYDDEGRGGL